jgi:hypothetical protein
MSPVVHFLTGHGGGSLLEHRVFPVAPRPGCDLCEKCRVHREADGGFYCTRDTEGPVDGGSRKPGPTPARRGGPGRPEQRIFAA